MKSPHSTSERPFLIAGIVSLEPTVKPVSDDKLSRALALWPDRPAMALLRALDAWHYPEVPSGDSTLDIGCGNGKFAEVIGLQGAVGLDLDTPDLDRARESSAYARVCVGDAVNLPFGDATFTRVVLNSTLEHIEDDLGCLKEIARILVPGGTLFLTVPLPSKEDTLFFGQFSDNSESGESLPSAYRRWFTEHWVHHRYRSEQEWRGLLDEVGLQLVESHPYESMTSGWLGDLLGYTKVTFDDVPIWGKMQSPRCLFCGVMYQFLFPYWVGDAEQCGRDPAHAGSCFFRAMRAS